MKTNSSRKIINSSASVYRSDVNFNCIDFIKFICAILVCILHVGVFVTCDNKLERYIDFLMKHATCRIAVPFFFVAAGFLLFRKMDINRIGECKNKIQNYCFKLLRLLGTWTFLLFVGGSYQLWYLGGLVVAVIFLSLLFYFKVPLKLIITLALVLYAIGLLGDSYSVVGQLFTQIKIFEYISIFYYDFWEITRNGVFMGFIFVLIGALFAHRKIVMNMAVAVIGFVISMGLLLLEAETLKNNSIPNGYNMFISLLPAVFFLFYIATHINLKDRKIYAKLRVVGMLIFYLHLFVKFAVNYVAEFFALDSVKNNLFIILTITCVISFIIEWLSHKEKLSWIKWLYS